MKLTKTLLYNRSNLEFEGFTNLGKYTPKHQQGLKGDHALVVMFQPFKGKWIQSLGCFLSRGSATPPPPPPPPRTIATLPCARLVI